ncbi:MAG TPA: cupin domain-containing protein [Gaiellaceae bacterium]|nr:cupin domain-containing protein [Gaiellaceae bacterium]
MEVRSRDEAPEFTTLDGSTIKVILDAALGGAANQSLAEASLAAGQGTERHYHGRSEEIYVFLEGGGEMEVDGDSGEVSAGDAVLIPAGAWHRIVAGPRGARFLCCCAPPYADEDTFFGTVDA